MNHQLPTHIEGKLFNRLFVVKKIDKKTGNKWLYECRCSCGNVIFTDKYKLQYGHTKSCGCLKLDLLSINKYVHGMTKTPEYKAWIEMKQRCYNKDHKRFNYYGGRGIHVCDKWLDSFQSFYDDLGKRNTKKHSLDRIDVNGNYEPSNCRWATPTEQSANRRDTTKFLFNGELMALSHIAKLVGIPQTTMQRLVINKKMSIQEAIATRL